jgi:flavodoxin
MKRILILALAVLMAASCATKKSEMKALVLYYSQNGTTKAVAEEIAGKLGADIEAIVPVTPYDGDFMATIERGKKELDGGILPEIQPIKADIQSYDVIFLGFPIWFGVYATPVFTVLENVDFSGKKIVPFCTFGSGGIDSASRALAEKLTSAEILPGYGVRTARIDAAPAELDRFLKENGFLEGDITPLEPFPALHPASEEEAAIFDAAVDGYPMLNAKAEEVAARSVPGGTEYIFTAKDQPRQKADAPLPPAGTLKIYVLAEDGKAPVFTQVIR